MSVVKNTIVVAELLKQFKDMNDDFLGEIKSMDDKVNNDVINFNEIGADPDVLIDNTIYPIASAQRTDDNRPVSLHKFDTKNTTITEDELFALGYDKKSSVLQSHRDALKLSVLRLGAHSLAPASDTLNTPVLQTTGASIGGRKRITMEDIISFKDKCDKLQIPMGSRVLVLSSTHANDIILIDQSFRDRYNSTETGKLISRLYGFKIFESIHTPVYSPAYAKKAYGALAAGTDKEASVFFSTLNAMKATGSAKMFYADAAQDPEMRESKVGFRMYNIVSPVTVKGIGAIVSGS
jgi:hypothetical protein